MTKLLFHGAEIMATGAGGGFSEEARTGGGAGTITRDTSVFRSGLASYKCTDGGWLEHTTPGGATPYGASQTAFARIYVRLDALPSSAVVVMQCASNFSAAPTSGVSVKITSGGKVQLFNEATNAQIGSDSSATISTGSWYRLEIKTIINSGGNITDVELRLDGTTVASASGLSISTTGSEFLSGNISGGASVNVYVDDVSFNDSAGTVNNSWCDNGKVVLLSPISDSAVGTSWTTSGASTSNLWDCVNNTPPTGIADTTANEGHQIRNAGSNTASYDANMTSYTTAGIGASDTINAILPWLAHAAPVSTGAKTGNVGVASNPTISQAAFVNGVSADFWTGTAAGTFTTGWVWDHGTLTEAPAVTLGTSPVMRVTITGGTASRIAMVCGMFIYVDYTPAVSAFQPRQEGINFQDPGLLARVHDAWERKRGILVPKLWVPEGAVI